VAAQGALAALGKLAGPSMGGMPGGGISLASTATSRSGDISGGGLHIDTSGDGLELGGVRVGLPVLLLAGFALVLLARRR
jgi:hypothetical protein